MKKDLGALEKAPKGCVRLRHFSLFGVMWVWWWAVQWQWRNELARLGTSSRAASHRGWAQPAH